MKRIPFILAAALLFGLLPAAQAPAASASTGEQSNEEAAQHTLHLPLTGEEFTPEELAAAAEEQTAPSHEELPSLNPISIGLCNIGQQSHVIDSVASGSGRGISLGIIDLKCGTEKTGYVHIRKNHEKDWQYFINKHPAVFGPFVLWDDFMWFATSQALAAPNPSYNMPQRIPGQKVCYSTPVQIRDSQGNVVDTMNPSVIVSENNKLVITSIPTSNTPHCK